MLTAWHVGTACPSPEPLDVVFVLGAARSGTSALAGALERLGLPFGPAVREPEPDNERGRYENRAIALMNLALLGPTGGEGVRPVQPEDEDYIHDLLHRYPAGRAGIKDPNMLFVLPLWAKHVRSARLVATVRHPMKVARSVLQASAGRLFDEATALERWTRQNEQLLELRRRVRFPVLNFDAPLPVYFLQLQRAAAALGMAFDQAAVSDFVDESLRHQREEEIPSGLLPLYHALVALTEEETVAEEILSTNLLDTLPVRLDGLRLRSASGRLGLEAWHFYLRWLAVAIRDARALEEEVASRDAQMKELRRQLAETLARLREASRIAEKGAKP